MTLQMRGLGETSPADMAWKRAKWLYPTLEWDIKWICVRYKFYNVYGNINIMEETQNNLSV